MTNPISALLQQIAHNTYNRMIRAAFADVFDRKELTTVEVLGHLARFCYATESTVKDDTVSSAVAQGRREVWLEIQRYLNLQDAELAEIDRHYREQMAAQISREYQS